MSHIFVTKQGNYEKKRTLCLCAKKNYKTLKLINAYIFENDEKLFH